MIDNMNQSLGSSLLWLLVAATTRERSGNLGLLLGPTLLSWKGTDRESNSVFEYGHRALEVTR